LERDSVEALVITRGVAPHQRLYVVSRRSHRDPPPPNSTRTDPAPPRHMQPPCPRTS
jgi:hypothetical protein